MTDQQTQTPIERLNKVPYKVLQLHSKEMFEILSYIYRNPENHHSAQIKIENLLIRISDESHEAKNNGHRKDMKAYVKKDWTKIYEDRRKGMSINDLHKKHGEYYQTIQNHFKRTYDPLKAE